MNTTDVKMLAFSECSLMNAKKIILFFFALSRDILKFVLDYYILLISIILIAIKVKQFLGKKIVWIVVPFRFFSFNEARTLADRKRFIWREKGRQSE